MARLGSALCFLYLHSPGGLACAIGLSETVNVRAMKKGGLKEEGANRKKEHVN